VNLTKSKCRYSLHNDTANSLLMAHVSGPPQRVVNDWYFGSETVSHMNGCNLKCLPDIRRLVCDSRISEKLCS
jgi:hypothetical protein